MLKPFRPTGALPSVLQIWRQVRLHKQLPVIGLLLFLSSASIATAAQTLFSSRAEFQATLGTFRVFTFEPDQGFSIGLIPSFDDGRIETRSELGPYFGPASIINYADTANQVLVGQELAGPHPNSNVRLLFAYPQFAIGFDSVGARETVVVNAAYVDHSTSQHVFDANDQQRFFIGLRSDVAFRDVFIMGANRDDPNNPGEQPNHIDNLTLVPEPGAAALVIAAVMTRLLQRRNKTPAR